MPTTQKPRTRKPPEPSHGTCRWLRRPRPGALERSGACLINGTAYGLIVHPSGLELFKADGTVYRLSADLSSCDCPDATYRPGRPDGGCKHKKALAKLLGD